MKNKTLRKAEVKFLRAEKKAMQALTALAAGGGIAAIATLQSSVTSMKSLLPGFEAELGSNLSGKYAAQADQAIASLQAAVKAGNAEGINAAVSMANYAIISAHHAITDMLPSGFTPLVYGSDKPPEETVRLFTGI
ncbi:MAG: hypothetical protein ACWA5L_11350 [bacterium]